MPVKTIVLRSVLGCAFLLVAGTLVMLHVRMTVSATARVVQDSGCLLPNFRELASIEEAGAGSMIAGDFNGDYNVDVLVANPTQRRVTAFKGDGRGGLVRGSVFSTALDIPVALYSGDFNGDRLTDALVLLESSSRRFQYSWAVWFSTPSGALNRTAAQSFETLDKEARYEVIVEDFNNDGKTDMVVGNAATAATLVIRLSRGDSSFAVVPLANFYADSFLFTQDWFFDGRPDLFIAQATTGRINMLQGNGDGTFRGPLEVATYNSVIRSFAQGDLNRDGLADWLLTTGERNDAIGTGQAVEDSFQLFYTLRNGQNGFEFSRRWPERWRLWQVADVTGDRKPDAILRADDNRAHAVTINGGQFNNCYRLAYAPFEGLRLLADLTQDGQVEAITLRDARLAVWLNQSPAPVTSANQPPSATVSTNLVAEQGATISNLAVADVSDLETPAAALRVDAVEVPVGVTVALTNTNGKVSGVIQVACQWRHRNVQFILRVTDAAGASVLVPVPFSVRGITTPRGLVNQPAQIEMREGISALFSLTREGGEIPVTADIALFSDVDPANMKLTVAGIELQRHPNSRDFNRLVYQPIVLPVGTHTLRVTTAHTCGQFVLNEIAIVVRGATSTCAYPAFDAPQVYAGMTRFRLRAVGDFNGDGRADAVTTDGNSINTNLGTVNIFSGGTGGLVAHFAPPWDPRDFKPGDFNNDGRLDLAVSRNASNARGLAIYLNNGQGSFTLANQYAVGSGNIATGDFNQDGKMDLVIAETIAAGVGGLTVLLGEGNGNFVDRTTAFMRGTNATLNEQWRNGPFIAPYFSAARNTLDLALSNGFTQALPRWHNWLGDGRGGFTGGTGSGANVVTNVFSGDFDGDGRLDFAATHGSCSDGIDPIGSCTGNYNQSSFSLLGRFYRNFTPTGSLATADFNLDGRPDVAASTGNILVSGTPGAFCAVPKLIVPGRTFTGDFNGDGKADLLVNDEAEGRLLLYFNRSSSNARTLAVVSAAHYRPVAVARDSIVSAFGASLTTTTETARTVPLPTMLAGVQIIIRDNAGIERNAPLFFASAGQVNFLIPAATAEGVAVIRAIGANSVSSVTTVNITSVAPGLFSANASGSGIAAAQVLRIKASGQQIYEPVALYDQQGRVVPIPIDYGAAGDQLFLVLYGTGWRGRSTAASVSAEIAGYYVEVLFAGAHPNLIGVDQLNLRLPRFEGISGVTVGLSFTVGDLTTNRVQIVFK